MFVLSSIFSGLEFWSVSHTSIYENSELNVFKNIKVLDEMSNYWSNDLIETNLCKTLESWIYSLLTILQWTNTTSLISKWGIFSPFSSLVVYCFQLNSLFQELKVRDDILF